MLFVRASSLRLAASARDMEHAADWPGDAKVRGASCRLHTGRHAVSMRSPTGGLHECAKASKRTRGLVRSTRASKVRRAWVSSERAPSCPSVTPTKLVLEEGIVQVPT